MIEYPEDKFWGNYRGQVVSVDDPLSKGRIRVRILPAYSGSSDDALPWAIPAMPLFCGAKSGYGSHFVPDVGSWVWCFFENGEYTQPVYFAEAPNGAMMLPGGETDTKARVLYSSSGCYLYFDDRNKEVKVYSTRDVTIVAEGTDPKIEILATGSTASVSMTATGAGAAASVVAPSVTISGSDSVNINSTTVVTIAAAAVNIN